MTLVHMLHTNSLTPMPQYVWAVPSHQSQAGVMASKQWVVFACMPGPRLNPTRPSPYLYQSYRLAPMAI